MQQLGSYWRDLREILYFTILQKRFLGKIEVSLNSDNSDRSTLHEDLCRFIDHISLISSYNEECFRKKSCRENQNTNFDVWLTVYLTKFISVFNQFDAQNLIHNKFYFMPLHVSSICAHHQEIKIALHSLWFGGCVMHMCSSSGSQICITQPLVSPHL